jgi:hypothetical protein
MFRYRVFAPVWDMYFVDAESPEDAVVQFEKGCGFLRDTVAFDGRDEIKVYAELDD